MKKLVFASMMALASTGLMLAPALLAQQEQPKSLSIQNPAEYNDYEMFSTQQNAKAKADAGEEFLKKYPQSIAKQTVLQQTMEAYEQTGDLDGALSAATRLLQVDPNNLEAIYVSVSIKKAQCAKTSDAQTCDDAAALAQKGLQVTKPAAMADDEWQKLTAGAFPVFRSAIALDDWVKKDYKGSQDEYTDELKMYDDQQSKSAGLTDTLLLAQAYSMPGSSQNLPLACWLYARVWDFAPQAYKNQIEPKLEYYYKRFHGKLDGLDQLKQQAQASTFPPAGWTLTPAPSPQETIHNLLQTTDPKTLALADKETILAMGAKPDADAMWAVLQGQQTQVPGTVLEANATSAKIVVTVIGHPRPEEFASEPLKSPMACSALPEGEEAAAGKDFITNSVTPDDKLSDLLSKEGSRIRHISIVGLVPTVKMAVTQDAKAAKVPDFIVNMKDPVSCKDIPAVGADFVSNPGAAELVGTYSTYRQVPATSTTSQAAEIVLSDGEVIPAEPAKKPTPVHRAVRRPAH
jgi:hypothetical protein